jgi:hypothetical protein
MSTFDQSLHGIVRSDAPVRNDAVMLTVTGYVFLRRVNRITPLT